MVLLPYVYCQLKVSLTFGTFENDQQQFTGFLDEQQKKKDSHLISPDNDSCSERGEPLLKILYLI